MGKKPAYMVIGDALRARIESRELGAGAKLPSERELVDDFGVARMTVRHALDMLQEEGFIERRRGRSGGTFVRATPPVLELTAEAGFEDHFAASGENILKDVIEDRLVEAPLFICEAFGVETGSRVRKRQVVFSSEGQPIMYATAYTLPDTPGEHGAGLRRDDVLTAARASDSEREQLQLPTHAVVQRVCRRTYARTGTDTGTGTGTDTGTGTSTGEELVEYTLIAVRPDAAQLRAVTVLPGQ